MAELRLPRSDTLCPAVITMPTSFLLRFQEPTIPPCSEYPLGSERSEPTLGRTKTAVFKEQPDHQHVVNPPLAGTKTITEVKREQSDVDPASRSFLALPR